MGVHTRILLAAGLAVLLLTAVLNPAFAASAGTVTVTAHVNSIAEVSWAGADAITIRANADWRLTCETPEGPVEYRGGGTPGRTIELPEGTVAYSLAVE